ncbi:MAG: ornithine carbamoyltransferase [Sporomusaceae bacterium]|nr:ornithine carbamoyltransferase [Sporomusaceae bacterium]
MSLGGKDLLSLHDLTVAEMQEIFDLTAKLKQEQKAGIAHPILKGKTLAMIFQKSSTRTRVSFEVGMYQLGGSALFLSAKDLQIGRGEPVKDTARVLSRYVDGIMVRTYSHERVQELAEYASVPVINALTDLMHPCQVLADLFTAIEHKGDLKGKKLAYIGDGNNMVNSLLHGCAKLGMHISVASPKGYEADPVCIEEAKSDAAISGSQIVFTQSPAEAAKDADVIYTDVWASMGQEAEQEKRVKDFAGFIVDEKLLAVAKPDVIVMHCLPAHRGEEISEGVMEGPHSVIFDEAENRLHVQKAVMALTMGFVS